MVRTGTTSETSADPDVDVSTDAGDDGVEAMAGAPLRVLCVEDNHELATYFQLEFDGEIVVPGRITAVTLAEDLAGARAALESADHDLVLLDLALPDSTGVDTLLGVVEVAGSAPIIIVTGTTDVDFGERALLAGAHDFLIKGRYTSTDLRRCVRFAVARQRRTLETTAALTGWTAPGAAGPAGLIGQRAGELGAGWSRRVPLDEAFPNEFAQFVATYTRLVLLRVEEQGLRVDYQVSSSCRVLAGDVGRLRGRAHDVAQVHVRALGGLTNEVSGPRARALGTAADSLLLETLGSLVSYYRDQLIGVASYGARGEQDS